MIVEWFGVVGDRLGAVWSDTTAWHCQLIGNIRDDIYTIIPGCGDRLDTVWSDTTAVWHCQLTGNRRDNINTIIPECGDRLDTVWLYTTVWHCQLSGNRRDNINTIMPECGLVTSNSDELGWWKGVCLLMAASNDYGCVFQLSLLCSRCGWLYGKMSILQCLIVI